MISITKLNDTDVASARTFNRPIEDIELALNSLNNRLSTATNKEALMMSGVLLDDSVKIGDIVYMRNDGICAPAIAALDQTYDNSGPSIESEKSRVLGMVISMDGNIGTLLVGGRYKDALCTEYCIGESPEVGVYYLSDITPGKVTKDPGNALKQPVLVYMGADTFSISVMYQAQNTHFHAGHDLTADWESCNDGVHTSKYAGDYTSLGASSLTDGVTAVFHNGVLSDDFPVNNGVIYSKLPVSDIHNVKVFTAIPTSYSTGVVRNILPGDDSITVEASNGIVKVMSPEPIIDSTAKSATAISKMGSGHAVLTPVVSGISTVGDDISCDYNNKTGDVTIYGSGVSIDRMMATEYNLNGSKHVSDDIYTYVVLPGSRKSSVTVSRDIVKSGTSSTKFKVWVDVARELPETELTVDVFFTPYPAKGTPTQLVSTSDAIVSTTIAATSAKGKLTHCISDDVAAVFGAGILSAKISADTPGIDVYMLRAGFCVIHDSGE